MNRKMFRFVTVLLTFLFISSVTSGCGVNKTEVNQENSTAQIQQQPKAGPEALTLPIVNKSLTLTCFTGLSVKAAASLKSHEEVACYKELEKRTGIHIQFIHPPVGQEKEQFNLIIASNELPDMIYWNFLSTAGGPARLLDEKMILKLNDPIEKYAPNLKKVYESNPDAKKQSTLDDGTYYNFPFLRLDPFLRAGGPVIRKDWLDKLGLELPKTMDDWYKMLKAFKEKDPNGNGTADEIPLLGMTVNPGQSVLESVQSFTSMFGITQRFYQSSGKVKYGAIEPAYKDFIVTMNKWYKEGLIDTDFAATDSKNFDAKVTSEKGGAYIGRIGNTFGRYMTLMGSKNPKFDLTGAPWPIGPGGKPYNIRIDMVAIATGEGTVITSKNKYVKESVKWLDYAYSEEGSKLMNFGIENESYKMENGYPKYTDKILKNSDKLSPGDVLAKYAMAPTSGSFVQDKRYFEQILDFPQQIKTIEIWAKDGDTSLLLPPLAPTSEESAKMAQIMSDVDTYVAEMFVKFVMGIEPIDKFDAYVQTIKKMGIEDAIKMQQAALERFNKR